MSDVGKEAINAVELILKEVSQEEERPFTVELSWRDAYELMRGLREENYLKIALHVEIHPESLEAMMFRKINRSLRIDPDTGEKFKRWKPGTQHPDKARIDLNGRELNLLNETLMHKMQLLRGKVKLDTNWTEEDLERYNDSLEKFLHGHETSEQRKERQDFRLNDMMHLMLAFKELNEAFIKAGGPPHEEYLKFKG